MNYIKDIQLNNGDGSYNAIIEIEKGTNSKTELVPDSFDKVVEVRKVIGNYPYFYGCLPQTLAGDNDPIDVIIFSNKKHHKLEVAKVQIIGVIKSIDNGEVDDKLLAIMIDENIKNVHSFVRRAYKFLHTYKGKSADMQLAEKAELEDVAKQLIEEAHKAYRLNNNKHKVKLSSF